MTCPGRGAPTRTPPSHSPSPPPHWIMDRFWQPRQKSRMASVLETVSMIAEFGQQQWSYTNFGVSDRTLRSRDRIFKFSQELVKICAAAKILDTCVNFDRSGRYNQPVQYGRDAAHKSRAAWAGIPRGVYMSERQHIYEDLNESSSARPGGSQQLEIPPSPNSKRTPNFFADIWLGAEIFTRRGDFNARQGSIVRLYFYQAPIFCVPAQIFIRRQYFWHPPEFSWDANILSIRQNFHETPRFRHAPIISYDANILGMHQ